MATASKVALEAHTLSGMLTLRSTVLLLVQAASLWAHSLILAKKCSVQSQINCSTHSDEKSLQSHRAKSCRVRQLLLRETGRRIGLSVRRLQGGRDNGMGLKKPSRDVTIIRFAA
jgi:hypothetical protein